MRIDLHTHSTASDGTLAPAALIERAQAHGVDLLALTDHDTTAGIQEAQEAAQAPGLQCIPGVEISVSWNGRVIHIVGLRVDPRARALRDGLAGLQAQRRWRAEEMGRRLERAGLDGMLGWAQEHARGGLVVRTHFARALVSRGACRSMQDAFNRYLKRGRPGHVAGRWAALEDAVHWVRAAGGLAVVAHPARYKLTRSRLRALLEDFKDCGGAGLEVVSGTHSANDIAAMGEHARRLDLYASAGSDYHGPEQTWLELGALPPLPQGCLPIWERL